MNFKERIKRLFIMALTMTLISGLFLYGFITVYSNTYYLEHHEPLTVFSFDKNEDTYTVIIMNHSYKLEV